MTTASLRAPSKKPPPSAAREPQDGYAGKLLRVDLTKKKCWAEPWSPDAMRELVGGVGLGAMSLYRETAKTGGKGNLSWDHPDDCLVMATGPMSGIPAFELPGSTAAARSERRHRPSVSGAPS